MSSVFPDPWRELGEFIREQRSVARLSVRRLSDMAGISNPYLSQIERGLRRPSAEILQQIAKALQLSAETLYVRAGILDPRGFEGDLTEAILAEPQLTEEQKHALLRIYTSFRRENGPAEAVAARGETDPGRDPAVAPDDQTATGSRPGPTGPAAGNGSHPA
ncbi:MAG: helix-turn-helix transcriptional regulator [Actinomycetota bacterium]|nr:helix-turn-helix transcriptional regulator [Actinomycetota bacterium]